MRVQLNKKLVRELMHIKMQVISIAVVVGIGVAVMFGFSSTYESLKKSRDDFYKLANFSDIVLNVKKAPDFAASHIEQLPEVVDIETRLEYEALLSVPNFVEPAVGHFISIPDGQQPDMNQLFLRKGRLPQSISDDEVVVTQGFFKAHDFQLGDQFSATLNGRKKNLIIVGVGITPEHIIALQPGAPFPDDKHFSVVWMNESAIAATYDMRASFNSAIIKVLPGIQEEMIIKKIDDEMDRYGGVGARGRDKQISHVYVREELKQLQVQAISIPIVFFLVAAFILNVVISRMVRAQRSEIATLKALGYFDREISQYYFKVAAVIVLTGSVLGLAMGYWIGNNMTQLYGEYYHFPKLSYSFSYSQLILAMSVSLVTASIGVYSSLRGIFKLQPAEAMRPPTPHFFHRGILERQDWFRAMKTRTKMILRGITNFPVKSSLTGFGLSFAIVILISGLFWGDTMDHLLLAQYSFTQKETGSIALTHSLSPLAVHEVRRLPGIIEAEGYRRAAVKVRFQNREETTAIKGLPENARLMGLIDQDLRELSIPKSGVMISEILASQLGVKTGDTLELEFLEGRKPTIHIQVQGVVGILMSNELLAPREFLAQILKTDDRVDNILFRSYSDSQTLYTKLKQMPNVLTVAYRDSVLEFFNEGSKKFILVFAFILSIFAGAIGFGVAYNSMRVALAERDWELATLRILGFTVPEVFQILIGEIVLLLVLFIPIGWYLGFLNADWLVAKMSMENFKIPFLINSETYFWATFILVLSAGLSGAVIYRLILKSDMVATLKSRG